MADNNGNNGGFDDLDFWATAVKIGGMIAGASFVTGAAVKSVNKSQIKKRIQEIDEKLAELERHPFWNASEISQLKQERAQLAAKL